MAVGIAARRWAISRARGGHNDRPQFRVFIASGGWTTPREFGVGRICSGVLGEMTPLRVSTGRYPSSLVQRM